MFLLKENGLRGRVCKEASIGKEAPFNTGQPRQCINAILQKQHLSPYNSSITNGGRREKCNPKGDCAAPPATGHLPSEGFLGEENLFIIT